MTTVADILTRVQRRLSMIAGPGVQRYAQDNILEFIETAYERLIEKDWWPDLMVEVSVALDGTTGKPTTNLKVATQPLLKLSDIRQIRLERDCRGLPQTPSNIVPSLLSGTTPRYYQSDPDRIFKVVPATSTGSVFVNYRTRYSSFTLDTEVLLDPLLIVLASAYEYMVDDGTNPMAMSKLEGMLNKREQEVMNNLSHEPIPLNNYEASFSYSTDWQVS